MKAANTVARNIMKDEKLRNEAQLRLNVTSSKLYTSLIREFFKNNKKNDEVTSTSQHLIPGKKHFKRGFHFAWNYNQNYLGAL